MPKIAVICASLIFLGGWGHWGFAEPVLPTEPPPIDLTPPLLFKTSPSADGIFDPSSFSTDPFISTLVCPTTREEWLNKRKEIADSLTNSITRSEEADRWRPCFSGSAKLFKSDPKLRECFAAYVKTVDNIVRLSRATKFLKGSEKEYAQDQKNFSAVPDEFKSPTFLSWLSNNRMAEVDQYIEVLNQERKKKKLSPILQVRFLSPDIPPFKEGEGKRRLMIYYPGDYPQKPNVEKWLNISVPDTEVPTSNEYQQMAVVSVHTDKNGKQTSYFTDHRRKYDREQPRVAHSFDGEDALQGMNCVKCHSSGGPLGIYPDEPVSANHEKNRTLINQRIGELPITLSNHFYGNPANRGIVWESTYVSEGTIRQCFQNTKTEITTLTASSIDQVRKALNCVECHNGLDRGRFSSMHPALARWVRRGAMPKEMDPPLTMEERAAVINCLTELEPVAFKDSLLNSPCSLTGEPRPPSPERPIRAPNHAAPGNLPK